MTYLITFACYGAHLHGDESGSVDRHSNVPGRRLLIPDLHWALSERAAMAQHAYILDPDARAAVLQAIRNVCVYRDWRLLAAHVRTNHVHVTVDTETEPEKVMNAFKSYASRLLNRAGHDGIDRKRWARHGSTRWLWKDQDVRDALGYVIDGQGEPMALFVADNL